MSEIDPGHINLFNSLHARYFSYFLSYADFFQN